MFNILINCVACATILLGGNMEINNIQKSLLTSNQAYIIVDNNYNKIDNIKELNNVLNQMLEDSHEMPAVGVSIHTETLIAIKSGTWLKLQYDNTKMLNNITFDELLIEIKPDFTGFNIIRGNKGIYEGRCFYIDLVNKDMSKLYNYIQELNN